MKLNIGDLIKRPGTKEKFDFVLTDLPEVSSFEFLEPIQVEGEVVNTGLGLALTGYVRTAILSSCDRCLDKVKVPLEFDFNEDYLPATEAEELSEEIESDLVLTYNEDWLDLSEVVKENLLLNLPMRTVCKSDCPGICPKCGKNLKEGTCQCNSKDIDPRLAALAKWKASH